MLSALALDVHNHDVPASHDMARAVAIARKQCSEAGGWHLACRRRTALSTVVRVACFPSASRAPSSGAHPRHHGQEPRRSGRGSLTSWTLFGRAGALSAFPFSHPAWCQGAEHGEDRRRCTQDLRCQGSCDALHKVLTITTPCLLEAGLSHRVR